MPFEPTQHVRLGRTGLEVTRLSFGGASIGGLYTPVADAEAEAVIEHAWQSGVRYFDVAPLYGYGRAEVRLGAALAGRPRDSFVVSTKVGRLVRDAASLPPDADVDPQALGEQRDAYYMGAGDRRIVFDYSADGVRRSLQESLERLRLDRIDIALIHDPDDHEEAAFAEAYPALEALRAEGVVQAIGVGMNQSTMLARFARETDVDVLLLAGRYSLLDQGALVELLPACVERDIPVLIAGVMNSGVLADPRPGSRFDYRPAPPDIVARAARIGEVCRRNGVPVKVAAIQFPLAHPAIAALVTGVRSIEHFDEYPAAMRADVPGAVWDDLRAEGLIAPDAPIPSTRAVA
ncbi:MAG: aldo/keto reductase [Chloroflexota bacterium]